MAFQVLQAAASVRVAAFSRSRSTQAISIVSGCGHTMPPFSRRLRTVGTGSLVDVGQPEARAFAAAVVHEDLEARHAVVLGRNAATPASCASVEMMK